jgi:pimeloyl-ACP methyl ester carboxylesterase
LVDIEHLRKLDHPAIICGLLKRDTCVSGEPGAGKVCGPVAEERREVTAPDGVTLSCRFFCGNPEEPHILFFPGEYDTEQDILDLAAGFGQFDFTVITPDYRGCGKSAGEACVSLLPGDAEAVYGAVDCWRKTDGRTGPLVIMGRSFGGAIALDLASRHDADTLTLVLESVFDRTEDFLSGKGLPAKELALSGKDPFSLREKMKDFSKAVLFLHSPRDEVVSIGQVEWLVAESRSKATQFQIVPSSGREDLSRNIPEYYFIAIKEFIYLRMGRRLPRKPRRG